MGNTLSIVVNLLLFWGSTEFVAFLINCSTSFRVIKDLADSGYKLKYSNLSNFLKKINSTIKKENEILKRFPIGNIIYATMVGMAYIYNKEKVLTALKVFDFIEEMSDFEKEEYSKKKTSFHAFVINLKYDIELSSAIKIKIRHSEFEKSEIYFSIKKSNIIIYNVEGYAKRLTKEEQIELIRKSCKKLVDAFENNNEQGNVSSKNIEQNTEMVIFSNNSDTENRSVNSRNNQIDELKQLKEELLQNKTKKDNEPLTKKRKK